MQIIWKGSKLWQLSTCSVIAFHKYAYSGMFYRLKIVWQVEHTLEKWWHKFCLNPSRNERVIRQASECTKSRGDYNFIKFSDISQTMHQNGRLLEIIEVILKYQLQILWFLDRLDGWTFLKLIGHLHFCSDFSWWPTIIITPEKEFEAEVHAHPQKSVRWKWNKQTRKKKTRKNVIDGRRCFIGSIQKTGEDGLDKLRVNDS